MTQQSSQRELKNPVILPAPLTRDPHGVQSRFSRSVTIGVRQEDRIEIRLYQLFDNHLRDAIADSGHTQDPFAAPILFRNGDCAHIGSVLVWNGRSACAK